MLIYPASNQVFAKDKPVSLAKLERAVLCCLVESKGCVVTNRELLRKVWGKDYQYSNDLLWRTMSRLRKKLSEASPDCEFIKVERDEGYKLI